MDSHRGDVREVVAVRMTDKALFAIKLVFVLAVIAGMCAIAANGYACCATVRVHEDSSLNVRRGPGTEYKADSGLANGAKLHIVREVNGWALVAWPKYPGRPFGWVSVDYLHKKMACAGHTDQ